MNQAEQRIGYIHSFVEYSEGLCEEDWRIWLPLIANACAQAMNKDFRKMGFEAMSFFNDHFYKKTRTIINKKTECLERETCSLKCRCPDSNQYSLLIEADFESTASTISPHRGPTPLENRR